MSLEKNVREAVDSLVEGKAEKIRLAKNKARRALRASKKKKQPEGRWVTMGGRRIFLPSSTKKKGVSFGGKPTKRSASRRRAQNPS